MIYYAFQYLHTSVELVLQVISCEKYDGLEEKGSGKLPMLSALGKPSLLLSRKTILDPFHVQFFFPGPLTRLFLIVSEHKIKIYAIKE